MAPLNEQRRIQVGRPLKRWLLQLGRFFWPTWTAEGWCILPPDIRGAPLADSCWCGAIVQNTRTVSQLLVPRPRALGPPPARWSAMDERAVNLARGSWVVVPRALIAKRAGRASHKRHKRNTYGVTHRSWSATPPQDAGEPKAHSPFEPAQKRIWECALTEACCGHVQRVRRRAWRVLWVQPNASAVALWRARAAGRRPSRAARGEKEVARSCSLERASVRVRAIDGRGTGSGRSVHTTQGSSVTGNRPRGLHP